MTCKSVGVAAAGVFLLAGCTAAATQRSGGPGRNLLTHEQLVATNSVNLYDALEKVRPEWLTSRGPTSVTDPRLTIASVFMNGHMLGKAESLREVLVADVTEVRFWPAGPAAARFGMGHPRGVIELTRK
jgi:hypothetical protein